MKRLDVNGGGTAEGLAKWLTVGDIPRNELEGIAGLPRWTRGVKCEILHRAADIVDREGWTQFHFAVDSDGEPVVAQDPDAAAWCATGAIKKAVHEELGSAYAGVVHECVAVAHQFLPKVEGRPDRLAAHNDSADATSGKIAGLLRRMAERVRLEDEVSREAA